MGFKGWFRGSGGGEVSPRPGDDLTIEDLIVLERYDEAESRLKSALKADPEDLHGHLKLAEVFTGLGRGIDAADQYVFVAEEYAKDGFYDKGMALLSKAMRLNPGDEVLRHKTYAFELAKGLDHKRTAALEGVRQSRHVGGAGTRMLHLQRAWHELAPAQLVRRLSVEQLRRFFTAVEFVRVEAGEELAHQADAEPSALWVAVTATVAAFHTPVGAEAKELRNFGSGDVLGESVLFSRGNWPATLKVVAAGMVLKLDRPGLEHTLAGNTDPVGFLECLRSDGNDADVARMVARLEGRG